MPMLVLLRDKVTCKYSGWLNLERGSGRRNHSTSLGGRWSFRLFLSQSLQVLGDPQTRSPCRAWVTYEVPPSPAYSQGLDSLLSKSLLLDQCSPVEIPAMTEMVYICTVQYGSHQPQVTT